MATLYFEAFLQDLAVMFKLFQVFALGSLSRFSYFLLCLSASNIRPVSTDAIAWIASFCQARA